MIFDRALPRCRVALLTGSRFTAATVSFCTLVFAVPASADVPEKIDFNLHIRPILAENCFKCHGVDERQRKGKLRLDVREDALKKKAFVPGKPDESELSR